jgi:NAD(P) transhydrogenase subunit alpha
MGGYSMKIATIKDPLDPRVALVPESVKKLKRLDAVDVLIEEHLSDVFSTEEYVSAGANVVKKDDLLQQANILLCVSKPHEEDLKKLQKGTLIISFLDVFHEKEYIDLLNQLELHSISLEMIPRTTLAQKMDAISSQASLAGYAAVIAGSEKLTKILPMMMTPAGTIKPAKVFIIGAGVAGLQAIATAKRLGANVIAFDTRPVVKEQVESLGAKFLEIDLGETGQTEGGYATTLTKQQLQIQQQEMAKVIQDSDLVITTAKLFGRKAPIIIPKDVVKGMKQGAVIVDLAASTGGNVEGTAVDQTTTINGVTIIGDKELAVRVKKDASIMLSSNMINLITHFWNKETNMFEYRDDEILKGCLITKDGSLVHKKLIEEFGG